MKNKSRQHESTPGRLLRKGAVAFVFAALATMSACSSGDGSSAEDPAGERAISFGIYENLSRGSITTTADLNKIGVFGYSHTGNFADALASRRPDYFLNKAVIRRNSAWTYDGVTKYWPQDGRKVSFFAYAPYQDVENMFVLKPEAKTEASVPKIEYTVPADVAKHIDLLWNKQLDKSGGTVAFTMDHALTRVGFSAKLDAAELGRPFAVKIVDITVANVMGKGTLDIYTGTWDIATPATDADFSSYTLTPAVGGGLNNIVFNGQYDSSNPGENEVDPTPANYYLMTPASGYLMLLPQTLSDGTGSVSPAQVTITYEIKNLLSGLVETKTETKDLAGVTTWTAGKGITYKINITLTQGVALEVETGDFLNADKWQPGGNDDITIS